MIDKVRVAVQKACMIKGVEEGLSNGRVLFMHNDDAMLYYDELVKSAGPLWSSFSDFIHESRNLKVDPRVKQGTIEVLFP